MKAVDRFLQHWRIDKTRRYIPAGARVLDIGCADGVLADRVPGLTEYVGIDPALESPPPQPNRRYIRGTFPQALDDSRPFDAITMLAVLEHVPPDQQSPLADDCAAYLKEGGRLIISVPSPLVDHILDGLKLLRVIDGMAVEEHYGYEVERTPELFKVGGLSLLKWEKFQLGLNNLFVFEKDKSSGSQRP
jgi:2-polyprenyl-3-methyl-5-hydroxy-6-metoxy-1,4-benzoquinol methylase